MTTEYEALMECLNRRSTVRGFHGIYVMNIMGHVLRNDDETRVEMLVEPAPARLKKHATPMMEAVKDYAGEMREHLHLECDEAEMTMTDHGDMLKVRFTLRRN